MSHVQNIFKILGGAIHIVIKHLEMVCFDPKIYEVFIYFSHYGLYMWLKYFWADFAGNLRKDIQHILL
jgi:hypothetical protein